MAFQALRGSHGGVLSFERSVGVGMGVLYFG
jgi:hypothetical protein